MWLQTSSWVLSIAQNLIRSDQIWVELIRFWAVLSGTDQILSSSEQNRSVLISSAQIWWWVSAKYWHCEASHRSGVSSFFFPFLLPVIGNGIFFCREDAALGLCLRRSKSVTSIVWGWSLFVFSIGSLGLFPSGLLSCCLRQCDD